MPRHFPLEPHVGQKVLVYPDPVSHPIEALVTYFDTAAGWVHVRPLHAQGLLACRPKTIVTPSGDYLHFQDQQFFFSKRPFLPSTKSA